VRSMIFVAGLILIFANNLSASQKFYFEKLSVDGIGGYELPCGSYSAQLSIYRSNDERLLFRYSATCDRDGNVADGQLRIISSSSAEKCWSFTPKRFTTTGCGIYDPESGTLTFEHATPSGTLTARWRECKGRFAAQRPCHE